MQKRCATLRRNGVIYVLKKHYTMQEIADRLGVNKSSVFRQLKKENIAPAMKEGNTNYYDAMVLQQLKQHFTTSNTKEPSKKDLLVETLQQQVHQLQQELESEKARADKQLQEKDNQIASLHKLMDQNQQLLLNEQNQQQLENKHEDVDVDADVTVTDNQKEDDTIANDNHKQTFLDKIFHFNKKSAD